MLLREGAEGLRPRPRLVSSVRPPAPLSLWAVSWDSVHAQTPGPGSTLKWGQNQLRAFFWVMAFLVKNPGPRQVFKDDYHIVNVITNSQQSVVTSNTRRKQGDLSASQNPTIQVPPRAVFLEHFLLQKRTSHVYCLLFLYSGYVAF